MVEIKSTTIISGIILAIILATLFKMIAGSWGEYAGLLLATIYVGFSVSGNYINGTIHGALVGTIGAVITGILSIMGFKALWGVIELAVGLDIIIMLIIVWTIIGAIGGTIGAIIKESGTSKEKPVT
ncbi:DUF5518 domain-containing protein [Methanobacterium sp.]|uniref:DUF5518 domain-containing protein n=1 Tax=Methanobacterium sp. TaxID=2164 RepID=UPI003C72A54A